MTAAAIAVILLLATAVFVRGIAGRPKIEPADLAPPENALREPLQFLGRGARTRIAELGPRIGEATQVAWRAAYRAPFDLEGCPKTAEWLVTPAGQRFERLLGDLRRGSREEAFAGLVLVFELARKTHWAPGLLARTQHVEKLAGFVQDWLRTWSERAALDPLLSEPALAAVLVYGQWTKRASEPRPIGRRAEVYDGAYAFLKSILRDEAGRPTDFHAALRARYPFAAASFDRDRDVLEGFDAAARSLFPEFTGECP